MAEWRERLALVVVERTDGRFEVQAGEAVDRIEKQFGDLSSRTDGDEARATLVVLDWESESVRAKSKELPDASEERATQWMLGEGPIG